MQVKTPKSLTRARSILFVSTALSIAVTSSVYGAESWVSTKTKAYQHFNAAASTNTAGAAAAPTAVADSESVPIVVSLKLRNEAQLDKEVAYLQSGASRQFLSPEQFAQTYAPTQQQVDVVVKHLTKAGYKNIQVSKSRQLITAEGTAATARTAFNTSLKHFQKDGRNVFANISDAQVPQSLANIVNAVSGLQTADTLRTYHGKISPVSATSVTNGATAPKTGTNAAAATTVTTHFPTDFPTIYNVGTVATASNTPVAILTWGKLDQTLADLTTYVTNQGLTAPTVSVVKTGSSTASGYNTDSSGGEWQLDSQTIVGASGGVKKLYFYSAPTAGLADGEVAVDKVVSDNLVKVVNVSYGLYEGADPSYLTALDASFKTAIAQGITFSVSAGDAGSFESTHGVPTSTYTVSAPASSPYVIAVGGTQVTTNTTGGTYSSEVTWNEGESYSSSLGKYRLWATGGGYSTLEAAPTWQSSTLTGSTFRALPDIAFDAAGASGVKFYYQGSLVSTGGTSLAAPIFTAFWARLNSSNANALGFPAASFYKYFPTNTSFLHDVASGQNGYGTSTPGYKAKAGWDATTGFGSFNVSGLDTFIKATADFAH
jgi:pseudomonalisin